MGTLIIDEHRAGLFVTGNDTEGIVFSLVVCIHYVTALARQIFLAINVCVDKAVVLHDGNGPSCDSVAVCLRIAVVVMLNIGSFYQVCQNKRQRNNNDIAKS